MLALLIVVAIGIDAAAQRDPFAGRWQAAESDRGVVVSLTFGGSNTLVMPGTGPSGRTEALTLALRNVRKTGDTATFSVDFPGDNGNAEFEFRLGAPRDAGTLKAIRVDGSRPMMTCRPGR